MDRRVPLIHHLHTVLGAWSVVATTKPQIKTSPQYITSSAETTLGNKVMTHDYAPFSFGVSVCWRKK